MAFRRSHLGFVFQEYNLLENLAIYENIALALTIKEVSKDKIRPMIEELAGKLAILSILDQFPHEVSGGQRQRCACARAIIANPDIIMRYLGRSGSQIMKLTRRQIAIRLTSPMIMTALVIVCSIPLLNSKMNRLLPNSMRHILLTAGAEFWVCILLFYLCYFGMVSVMSRSKTTGSSPSPKS